MNDRLFVARCSLALLFVGPVLPLLAILLEIRNEVAIAAIGIAAIVELLALICGIVGRQHLPGQIGLFGSLVVLVGFGMLLPLLMFHSDVPH